MLIRVANALKGKLRHHKPLNLLCDISNMSKHFLLIAIAFFGLGALCSVKAQPTPCAGLASISGQDTVCAGAFILLTDSTGGGAWSSGDTAVAAIDPSGVVTGISGGSVIITYLLSPGCLVTKNIVVNALLPIAGDTAVCVASTIYLSDLTTGGTWSSSNTTVATVDPATGATLGIASGNTVITYSLANGCTRRRTFVVNPLPLNYYVFGGGDYCAGTAGATIGLNGSDPGINYELYRNDTAFVDSLHGTGSAIFYGPYAIAGNYTMIAINTGTGCSSHMSGLAVIGITPLNIPHVSIFSATADTVCVSSSATFTVVPVNGGATPYYQWYVNGTAMGTATPTDTFSYLPVSGDVVSVTLYSDAVCAIPSTADTSVVVTILPRQTPSVSLSVSPSDSVCEFIPVTLIAAPTWGGPHPTYRWIKNGLTALIAPSYSYLPANGDNIICVLYSDYQCLTIDTTYSTNNVNITVLPLLVPTVTVTAHPGTTIGVGESDTVIAHVINGGTALSYQWEINSIAVPGATSDTFVSSTFANHDTVTCIVSSLDFCGGTPASAFLVITDTMTTTGIENSTQYRSRLRIFPNPNSGTFVVDGFLGAGQEWAEIEITDMLGRSVYDEKVPLQNGILKDDISLGNLLTDGVYLVHISATGLRAVERLEIGR